MGTTPRSFHVGRTRQDRHGGLSLRGMEVNPDQGERKSDLEERAFFLDSGMRRNDGNLMGGRYLKERGRLASRPYTVRRYVETSGYTPLDKPVEIYLLNPTKSSNGPTREAH